MKNNKKEKKPIDTSKVSGGTDCKNTALTDPKNKTIIKGPKEIPC